MPWDRLVPNEDKCRRLVEPHIVIPLDYHGLEVRFPRYGAFMSIDLNIILENFTKAKSCTISADADTKKAGLKKNIHLTVRYEGVSVNDLIDATLGSTVIAWQNGNKTGRAVYDQYTEGQHVTISFKAPSRTTVDIVGSFAAMMVGKSDAEIRAILDAETAKRTPPKLEPPTK